MSFHIPSGEPEPFARAADWISESSLPILLFTAVAAVSARAGVTARGRCQLVAVHLLALVIQLGLLRSRGFYDWGVGPIVVILLMGGLGRACWPPEGSTEVRATGLNRV